MKIVPVPSSGWQLQELDTSSYSLTGTSTETVLKTISIPGGIWKALKFTTLWEAGANNANAKYIKLRSVNLSGTQWLQSSLASMLYYRTETLVLLKADGTQISGLPTGVGGWGSSTSPPVTASLDATAAIDFLLSAQLPTSTDSVTLRQVMVEYLPK